MHQVVRETFTYMQQHMETEHHNARTGFVLFGGLSAALAWTLLVVWVGLVSLADHIR
jgi:type IV secretory pathway TrbL component